MNKFRDIMPQRAKLHTYYVRVSAKSLCRKIYADLLIIRTLPIEDREVGIVGTIKLPTESGKMIRLRFKENGDSNNAGQTVTSNIQEIYPTSDGKMWLPLHKTSKNL